MVLPQTIPIIGHKKGNVCLIWFFAWLVSVLTSLSDSFRLDCNQEGIKAFLFGGLGHVLGLHLTHFGFWISVNQIKPIAVAIGEWCSFLNCGLIFNILIIQKII